MPNSWHTWRMKGGHLDQLLSMLSNMPHVCREDVIVLFGDRDPLFSKFPCEGDSVREHLNFSLSLTLLSKGE